ncbi:MAG: ABC transporter substrate-binding protein [Rhodospirillales bacterium]
MLSIDQWRKMLSRVLLSLAPVALALGMAAPLQAQPKGDIVIALPQLSQLFDPTAMVGATPHMVYDFIFDGLINLGVKGKYPALAESWTISRDGKQIDFHLRKGVKFSNGDPFTAEDVKFTFDRVMAPDSGHAYRKGFVDSIDHIEVVNANTARFVLKNPWPAFFTTARYALTPIAPKAYYEKVGAKGFQDHPIGTGPFVLAGIKAGEWTKFEANPNYWGGAPHIKTVTQRLVGEPFTRYAMLEKGEADIVSGLTGPLLEKIKTNPDVKVISSRYSGTSGILFNKDLFPEAKDKRVRMAVGYAINRQQIADKIQGGVCEPATSMFTPGTFGFLDGLPQIPYDPAKAKALLAEAGVKPGTKVTFTIQTQSFSAVPNAPQVLEAIAGNLEAVGFVVERKSVDNAAWLAMMRGHKPTGIFYAPISIPDDGGEVINSYFISKSGWTAQSIQVPEYDKIFEEQLKTADLDARKKILQHFAKLEAENREDIPLLWCDTPFAASTKRIKDWQPALGSGYHTTMRSLVLK